MKEKEYPTPRLIKLAELLRIRYGQDYDPARTDAYDLVKLIEEEASKLTYDQILKLPRPSRGADFSLPEDLRKRLRNIFDAATRESRRAQLAENRIVAECQVRLDGALYRIAKLDVMNSSTLVAENGEKRKTTFNVLIQAEPV